ncbi:hypothetical protein ACFV24_27070 [Nocardia fluminea]|uniref:hypothetical protein n=1 Tax=Nocardia fluminea TaxID=134984 RepID=UPI00366DB218
MNQVDRPKPRWIRSIVRGFTAVAAIVAFAVVSIPAAHAEVQHPVAWTSIGIHPRTAPSMDAAHTGSALKDGTMVTLVCEQQGQAVFNGDKHIDVWAKISIGGWLPTAFINTKVDGWTPGVPRCNEPAQPAPQNKPQVASCGENDYVANVEIKDKAGTDFQIVVTPNPKARANPGTWKVVESMWHQVQGCVPGLYGPLADSIWQQLECHQMLSDRGGGSTWELESWRTPLALPHYVTYVNSHCLNRKWLNGPENGEPGTNSVALEPLHVA